MSHPKHPGEVSEMCSYRLLPRNACAVECSLTCCVFGVVWWGAAGGLWCLRQLLHQRQAESHPMQHMPQTHSTRRASNPRPSCADRSERMPTHECSSCALPPCLDHSSGVDENDILDFYWAPNIAYLTMPSCAPSIRLLRCINQLEQLQTLDLGDAFDESIKHIPWPVNLSALRIGHAFNRPLDGLPKMLCELVVGDGFNWSINRIAWPETLTALELGNAFNRHPNGLPPQLKHLRFGKAFNQRCDGVVWPTSLKMIIVSRAQQNLPSCAAIEDVVHTTHELIPTVERANVLRKDNSLHTAQNVQEMIKLSEETYKMCEQHGKRMKSMDACRKTIALK